MNIQELQVAKVMTLKSMLFFTRYFFKKNNNKKYIQGEHHVIISDALDRVFKGECKRLIINIGPRYGKTDLAVKHFIAKGLALNPASKFIHLSYSDKLALDNSSAVKEIVKLPEFQQMFPDVKIKRGTDAKEKWYTTAGGGVYAAAAGGQVTGFGAGTVEAEDAQEIEDDWFSQSESFSGAIIIDDPIKPEDANSDTLREQVNERFDSTIVNRVNSRNTPIIIIMQRLHENDLCGHIIKKYKGFEVISLPAIKKDGTALWPHKHTIEELNEQRKVNEFVFDTQMMQDPKPKHGLLFPKSELNFYKPDKLLEEAFESSISYADIADEGEDSLCHPIGRNIGKKIYLPSVVFNKSNTDITIPMLVDAIKTHDVKYCRVESNSMGAMFARNLRAEVEDFCQVLTATSTSNKHTRILMEASFIIKNVYFLDEEYQNEEYQAFMKELCSYRKDGKTKHDDAPDGLTGLTMFVRAIMSHLYN